MNYLLEEKHTHQVCAKINSMWKQKRSEKFWRMAWIYFYHMPLIPSLLYLLDYFTQRSFFCNYCWCSRHITIIIGSFFRLTKGFFTSSLVIWPHWCFFYIGSSFNAILASDEHILTSYTIIVDNLNVRPPMNP